MIIGSIFAICFCFVSSRFADATYSAYSRCSPRRRPRNAAVARCIGYLLQRHVAIVSAAQLKVVPCKPFGYTEVNHLSMKRVLGKILFWDEQLSSDDTVACGTCHIPAPVVVPPTSSGGGGSAGIWLLLLCLAFVTNHNPFHFFRPGTKDASISTAVFGGVHGVVRESQEPFGAIS